MIFRVSPSLRASLMSRGRLRVLRVGLYFEHSPKTCVIVMRVWHVFEGGVFTSSKGVSDENVTNF